MKKSIPPLLGILFISFVVNVLFIYINAPVQRIPLKIGINVWPGYAHAFIAQEQGFFQKQGVAVELVLKSELTEVTQLYKKGELDGLFGVFTDIIMLDANGLPTRVVYIADYSDTGDVIVGRSEFDSMRDLNGKTLSFEGVDTFSQMFVLSLLEKSGIQEGEFQAANLPAHEVLEALDTGKIDAGHTWEPTTSQALKKGYKILGKAGDIEGIIADILAFHATVIKERPAEIQGIVKAMLEAKAFLTEKPDEALSIMARAEGMSTVEMETGVKGVYHLGVQENVAAMQPGGTLFKSGRKAAEFYLRNGQLFQIPDFETLIDAQFIQQSTREYNELRN